MISLVDEYPSKSSTTASNTSSEFSQEDNRVLPQNQFPVFTIFEMPRPPFPELPFNSLYPILRQNWHLLPPQLPPLQLLPPTQPLSPAIAATTSNCKYPGIEDITTNNGVNISQPFRTSVDVTDQWSDTNSQEQSDRKSAEEVYPRTYLTLETVLREEAKEVSKISDQLFTSLSEVLDPESSVEESETDGTLISQEDDISLTGGVLSEFFIRHLPLLLKTETRKQGLKNLQDTLHVFSHAMASFPFEKVANGDNSRTLVYWRCFNFVKALRWALDDLRTKIRKNLTELLIMKCIKAVFVVILSLHYREKGYSMDVSETSERSEQPNPPFLGPEPRLVGINSDAMPFHPKLPPGGLATAMHHSSFSLCQDKIDDGNYSINHYDEFMAQEEQVFLERRLPVPTDGALVTMFHSHIVPMTPVVARNNGKYVRGTQRTELSIMDAAYAYDTLNGGCVIPCEFVLNKTYTPENNGATQGPRYLTYVGFVYPDNTMLSYIPIKTVRIVYEDSRQRQPILRSGSTTFAFLHMDLPNCVYQNLKMLAKEVYLRKKPEVLFVDHFEELQLDGRMVRIEVLVKSERTVRIEDQGRYLDYPVLQALFQCRHDLCGKSLMHLRFTSTKRGSQRMQLRLILFGITVERNPYNYYDPIFDLLNSPPGPIQTPLLIPGAKFY